MSTPILLPPSNSETALVDAIELATTTGRPLLLEPGRHFTKPGQLNTIEIGPHGLRMAARRVIAKEESVIQRPDFSIPAKKPDDNFGLFFVPEAPSSGDLSRANWRPGSDKNGAFEFAIFPGGSIEIQDLVIDANMGRQNIDPLDNKSSRSVMIGFAPKVYPAGVAPDGKTPRRAYVLFRAVRLHDLRIIRGGFADDIRFTPFQSPVYPIIGEVVAANIRSSERVNDQGSTLDFTGPPARVDISSADISQLHCESDADWRAVPRGTDDFVPSKWTLEGITARFIDFAMAGKIIDLTGTRLATTVACQIQLVGGTISDSVLAVQPGKQARNFRLAGLTYDHVAWRFMPDPEGKVTGLWLGGDANDGSVATYLNNTFEMIPVPGRPPPSGQLIFSVFSGPVGNAVDATFRDCTFRGGFGSLPGTKIAVVEERGVWRFNLADFNGLTEAEALTEGAPPLVTVVVS
jgi:hypothetical protein